MSAMMSGMSISQGQGQKAEQKQQQRLSHAQKLGIELLKQSLPSLRETLVKEIARNPVLEDIDNPLEKPVSELDRKKPDNDSATDENGDDHVDDDASDRHQRFLESIPAPEETLRAHLTSQIATSEIPEQDHDLAEMMIGDIDDSGRFIGSVPDYQMTYGKSPEEIERVREQIMLFDPPGCGALDLRECLLAQMKAIPVSPGKAIIRKFIDGRLTEILQSGRQFDLRRQLAAEGVAGSDLDSAVGVWRSLDPLPGRKYPNEHSSIEYINPEVTAVCVDGWWVPTTDERSLPKLTVKQEYRDLLEDSNESNETKSYISKCVASAEELDAAVKNRQSTLLKVATAIFDRQQDFFEKGRLALKPMTELEISKEIGVVESTVSRTVFGKYASTPFGTMELRRFFVSAVKTTGGTEVTQYAAIEALKGIVADEDGQKPMSDNQLTEKMKALGFDIKRRTVAKYRMLAGIPGASARRKPN